MTTLSQLLSTPLGIFSLISIIVIILCILVIFGSIYSNFYLAKKRKKDVKTERVSIVDTGTMMLFFFFVYALIKFNIGIFEIQNIALRVFLIILGLIVIVIGTGVNVVGRVNLGKNWANQINIYKDQTLVREGMYKYIRHPLYASLIWMFYAASFVYLNYLVFLANTVIFIPFMYYRSNQEEELLEKKFKDYKKYKEEVGRFFPRFIFGK